MVTPLVLMIVGEADTYHETGDAPQHFLRLTRGLVRRWRAQLT